MRPRFTRFATALFKRILKEASSANAKKCLCLRLLQQEDPCGIYV